MRRRFDWQANLPGIRAMIEAGHTGAEIARKYGLRLEACYNGLKRYGLAISPDATLAARTAAARRMSVDPVIRAKRARAAAVQMNRPEAKEWARRHWAAVVARDPDVAARANAASRTPEAIEKRRQSALEIWDARLAWLPKDRRAEYHTLVRNKRFTAEEAKAMILADMRREAERDQRLASERLRDRAAQMMRGGGRARISPALEPVA